MRLSKPEPIRDRHMNTRHFSISGCHFDYQAARELIDPATGDVSIRGCFIIKRDRFWRFAARRAANAVLHYMTFGAVPHYYK